MAHALNWRFEALRGALEEARAESAAREGQLGSSVVDLSKRLASTQAELARLRADIDRRGQAIEETLGRTETLVRAVAAEESANRRRLWALRADPGYEAAFEPEPLVTVLVITRERAELLLERALPSILGQSYERLEVIVVGDDATREVQDAVRSVRDPRLRFVNLTTRVVRTDPARHWLTAATLTRNEGYRIAEGRWLMDFDDDDALLPTGIETLVDLARQERAEVAYGLANQHAPDGTVTRLGSFPPRLYDFSLAAALVHTGLRFFAREFHAADLGVPGDWYRTERMLRAGVRFARVERPIFDYYPSTLWPADGA